LGLSAALIADQKHHELFELPHNFLEVQSSQYRDTTLSVVLSLGGIERISLSSRHAGLIHQARYYQLGDLVRYLRDKYRGEELGAQLLFPLPEHLVELLNRILGDHFL